MNMRERALSQKTLVCLLQSLEGKIATVEFRDEAAVTGKVEHVDGYMNVDMSNVNYVAPSGVEREFKKFCCQGKFVRYVVIPDDVEIIPSIKDKLREISRMPPARDSRGGRGGRRGRGGGFRSRGGRGGGGSRFGGGNRYGGESSSGRYGGDRYGGSSSRYGGGGDRYGGGGSSSYQGGSSRYGGGSGGYRY